MLEGSQSILKKFDFVSMKINLNYKLNPTVKNVVGGCLSLLMITLFEIIIIYFESKSSRKTSRLLDH